MKRTIGLAGIGVMALAGGLALAQPRGGAPVDADNDGTITRAEAMTAAEARFARMDADGDGSLTAADREAAMARRQAERFQSLDANGDGSISRTEWDQGHAAMKAKRAERMAARGNGDGEGRRGADRRGHHGGHMMLRADANGDKTISKAEFTAHAMQRFDRADADRNGVISAAEREAQRGKWGRKPANGAAAAPDGE